MELTDSLSDRTEGLSELTKASSLLWAWSEKVDLPDDVMKALGCVIGYAHRAEALAYVTAEENKDKSPYDIYKFLEMRGKKLT